MAEIVLVTGGAGFIGSNLVRALLRAGKTVRVLDDLSTGRKENLPIGAQGLTFIQGSILDHGLLKEAVHGVDCAFHQAALPSVQRSMEAPWESHQNNADGTLELFLAAKEANVRRVVYAGSSSAYGDIEILPKVETMAPQPVSVYAVSKLVGEYYGKVMTEAFGLEVITLRYFNVFGPRQDPASPYSAVIPLFIRSVLKGKSPVIFGDGRQSRDFCHVDNVVHANLLASKAPSGAAGQVFNVACGDRIDLLQLLQMLNKLAGTNLEPIFQGARPGDVLHSLADISAARSLLGYEVQVPFDEGLRRTFLWYRDQGGGPTDD